MRDKAVVLYPAPGMGHIVSMVELAKVIRSHHNHHFSSITILLTTGLWDTPNITSYIDSISQTYPTLTFRRFPMLPIDTSLSRGPASVAFEFIRNQTQNAKLALKEISEESNVCAFIIDLFCSSALSVSKELSIPTFYFYTSGASALAAFLQLPKIGQETTQSFKDLHNTLFEFHGLPPLKAIHMPDPVLDRHDPAYQDFMIFCSSLPLSDGIIVNTYGELEPVAIKAIKDGVCLSEKPTPPIYCVGPLIAAADQQVERECLSWLDKQPSRSVVFLCFGSRGSFSVTQIREIAKGLERSEQRFLWVLKSPPNNEKTKQTEYETEFDLEAILPSGFLERVKEMGMVVKSWIPQLAVLNHNSVGGFVTHCGWNSILEAVVAGVPMVAWPLYAEQHLNRNVLVEDMKLAIGLGHREQDEFVYGTELEKSVRELMETERGRRMRERSWQMREKALAAKREHGSSTKDLVNLVEMWKES